MSMYTTSPAFSIPLTSRKVFVNDLDCSPGPVYNTFGLNKKTKSSSFGNNMSKRTQINQGVQKTPAPTHYNPQNHKKNDKITFPKNQHKDKIQEDLPDPGFYSPFLQEGQIKGKTFSLGSKYPSIMDDINKTPGPGTYEVITSMRKTFDSNQKLKRSRSTFNTTSLRFKSSKYSPGPGEYDLFSKNNMVSPDNKGKFKQSQRDPITNDLTPGPGDYGQQLMQKALISKMGVTLKGRPKKSMFLLQKDFTENAFLTHEVGQSIKKIKIRILQFKIGNSQRKVFQGNNLPSSQDYFKQEYQSKNTLKIKFAQSRRKEDNWNENPGPGKYNPQSAQAISYSIKRSQSGNLFNKNLNPGVGRYDVTTNPGYKSVKGAGFLSSSRTNFISKNIAGVGDYEITSRVKSAITIPKSARFNEKERNPGPGEYNIPSSIGKYSSQKPKKSIQ